MPAIKQAIIALDSEVLDADKVATIQAILPTSTVR
jgi:hypothetical protein